MELKEGEKQEAKVVLQIHGKLDYSNEEQLKKVYAVLKKRTVRTSLGRKYLESLKNWTEDGCAPAYCLVCEQPLEEMEYCICHKCEEEIRRQCDTTPSQQDVKEAEKEIIPSNDTNVIKKKEVKTDKNPETNTKPIKDKKSKTHKTSKRDTTPKMRLQKRILVAVFAVVILLVMFCLYLLNNRDEDAFTFTGKNFAEAYSQNLAAYSLSLGEGTPADKNCYQYEILPTTDSLLVFEDNRGNVLGIELDLKGTGEENRKRQILLMSLMNVTIYENMTLEESGSLISELAKNQGKLVYEEEEWHLMLDGENAYYLIVKKQNDTAGFSIQQDARQENETSALTVQNTENETGTSTSAERGTSPASGKNAETEIKELGFYMGKNYEDLEAELGESTPVITENTRYFQEYGVSCIYDTDTGGITYLDCDAMKERKVSLCGIQIGDSKEKVAQVLEDYGYTEYQNEAQDLELGVNIGDNIYKLTISFSQDEVGLICLTREKP